MELALSSVIGIKPHCHLCPSIPFILWRKGKCIKLSGHDKQDENDLIYEQSINEK